MEKKYYEETFEVPGETKKFRFKKTNSIDILTIAEEWLMYVNTKEASVYKAFAKDVLSLVEFDSNDNGTWIPVVNGNSYLPATLESNLYGLNYITQLAYQKIISPVFHQSGESKTA